MQITVDAGWNAAKVRPMPLTVDGFDMYYVAMEMTSRMRILIS